MKKKKSKCSRTKLQEDALNDGILNYVLPKSKKKRNI